MWRRAGCLRACAARLSRDGLGFRFGAIVASWPTFDSSVSFDAIAFTRSLHHINPLRQAIVRARELLNPNGFLLIEDFALDDVNEATIAWFVKVLRSAQGKALIYLVPDQLAT